MLGCRHSCTATRTKRAGWASQIRSSLSGSEGTAEFCLQQLTTCLLACPPVSRPAHDGQALDAESVLQEALLLCRAVVEVVKQLGSNLLTGNFDLLKMSLPVKL